MVVLAGIAAFVCCCVLVFDTSSLDDQVRAGISIDKSRIVRDFVVFFVSLMLLFLSSVIR
jgi:hypothetical protein